MCMQTHYKHDEDERMAPGVRGHGSVLLSHSGNIVTRIGIQTEDLFTELVLLNVPGALYFMKGWGSGGGGDII